MIVALLAALVAGALTTLAPCSLSLLPVIVGGSVATETAAPTSGNSARRAAWRRALLVTGSLGVSVFIFTLALKASTALVGIKPQTWQYLSGGLLIVLGLLTIFPSVWDRFSMAIGLNSGSAQSLVRARERGGTIGAILTGASLGPVFTSCSPLFGYLIVTVLPAEPARGVLLLISYIVGLCSVLLAVALLGQRIISKLRWAADPHGAFRRGVGIVLVVVGVLIATGAMQSIETWLILNSPITPWDLGSPQID